MKKLIWLALTLQIIAIGALSVLSVKSREIEADLTRRFLEQKAEKDIAYLRQELEFEIAALLPEDAESKAKAILDRKTTFLNGENVLQTLIIRSPNEGRWISAGADSQFKDDKAESQCGNQLRGFPERFGSSSTQSPDRIEVVGCSYHDRTDYDDDTDAAKPAPERYAFFLKLSSPIHDKFRPEIPLGITMFALSVSLMLTLILGFMRTSPSPKEPQQSQVSPQLGGFSPSAAVATTPDPAMAAGFEIVVTPAPDASIQLSRTDSLPVTIATVSVRRTDAK